MDTNKPINLKIIINSKKKIMTTYYSKLKNLDSIKENIIEILIL